MALTNFPQGITSFGQPILASGGAQFSPFGYSYFIDTVNGSDANPTNGVDDGTEGGGNSPLAPFQTMARAFEFVGDNDVIYFIGTIREQLTAPLGVTGVSIIGVAGGGVRDDDGAKWTYPASGAVAGGALLELRNQGWVLSGFLMTPEPTSGACVKLHRQENATYPDASHAQFYNMRFVGIDVTTTYGLQDVGGCSAIQTWGCEFYLLTTGLYSSSQAIATPLRWQVMNSRFIQNTNDIIVPSSACVFQGNRHMTDNTVVMNIAGVGGNVVAFNVFPNAAADIDPAHGYTGNATDYWTSNSATDAVVFGVPA